MFRFHDVMKSSFHLAGLPFENELSKTFWELTIYIQKSQEKTLES
jgi:hypothetical protein